MDLATFKRLFTQTGQEALQAAWALSPVETDFLQNYQRLCKSFPADLARASLETAILRKGAQKKFPEAEKMFFTREALEQASSHLVAGYRAERYRHQRRILDLGCSVGSDLLAMARYAPVIGVDRDRLRLTMAHANAQALNLPAAFVQADLRSPLAFSGVPAVFFDPARRKNGRRVFSVSRYAPPLQVVDDWIDLFPAVGVKISPGVDLNEIASYDAEIEFISVNGNLKECVLWFGELKTARYRATLLPGGESLSLKEGVASPLPVSEPGVYLYEPDPAVIRSGLISVLGEQLDAFLLDPRIAYLSGNRYVKTAYARVWQIEDWFPFRLKQLRRYLRERGIGHVIVKKRGSPIEPDLLIRRLRLQGEKTRTLFLTRLGRNPVVLVTIPLAESASDGVLAGMPDGDRS